LLGLGPVKTAAPIHFGDDCSTGPQLLKAQPTMIPLLLEITDAEPLHCARRVSFTSVRQKKRVTSEIASGITMATFFRSWLIRFILSVPCTCLIRPAQVASCAASLLNAYVLRNRGQRFATEEQPWDSENKSKNME
jgi:hypothetical protein